MKGKQRLLELFSEKTKLTSVFPYVEEFKDKETSEEYLKEVGCKEKLSLILVEIILVFYSIITLILLKAYDHSAACYFAGFFLFALDIVLFGFLLCSKPTSYTYNLVVFLKYLCNLLYFIWFLLMIIFYQVEDKQLFISRIIFIEVVLSWLNCLVLVKSKSKPLIITTILVFLALTLLGGVSIITIEFNLNKVNTSLVFNKYCNKMINYTKLLNQSSMSAQPAMNESLSLLSSGIMTTKNSTMMANYSDTKASENSNKSIFTTSSEKQLFECLAYIYPNTFSPKYQQAFKEIGISFKTHNSHFYFIPEIIFCVLSFAMFYVSCNLNAKKLELFIQMKKNDILLEYFEILLNNMQMQLVSLSSEEDEIISFNKLFEQVVDENASIPSVKANYQKQSTLLAKDENNNDKSGFVKARITQVPGNSNKQQEDINSNNNPQTVKSRTTSLFDGTPYNANSEPEQINLIPNNNNNINNNFQNAELSALDFDGFKQKALGYLYVIVKDTDNNTNSPLDNQREETVRENNTKEIMISKSQDPNNNKEKITDKEHKEYKDYKGNIFKGLLGIIHSKLIKEIKTDKKEEEEHSTAKSLNWNTINQQKCEKRNKKAVTTRVCIQDNINKKTPENNENNNNNTQPCDASKYSKRPSFSRSSFEYLGIFTIDNAKYFKIFMRKFYYLDEKCVVDLLIDDITELKIAQNIRFESKLKQKLFSKITHEFKTPILVIKSLITDLRTAESREKQSELSNSICYLSEYVSFLINDIIYYTNDNSIKTQIGEVNLREVMSFCSGVSETLVRNMPGNKKQVKIRSLFDENLEGITLFSDSTRLKQVMLNFISNAVKFTKFGEITISAQLCKASNNNENDDSELKSSVVRRSKQMNNILKMALKEPEPESACVTNENNLDYAAHSFHAEKQSSIKEQDDHLKPGITAKALDYIKLSVKDTGIGLTKDDIQKLLGTQDKDSNNNNCFISINTSYAYNEMGTGLGVSISKSILSKLGHAIEIKSEYNKGSEFSIIIKNQDQREFIKPREKEKEKKARKTSFYNIPPKKHSANKKETEAIEEKDYFFNSEVIENKSIYDEHEELRYRDPKCSETMLIDLQSYNFLNPKENLLEENEYSTKLQIRQSKQTQLSKYNNKKQCSSSDKCMLKVNYNNKDFGDYDNNHGNNKSTLDLHLKSKSNEINTIFHNKANSKTKYSITPEYLTPCNSKETYVMKKSIAKTNNKTVNFNNTNFKSFNSPEVNLNSKNNKLFNNNNNNNKQKKYSSALPLAGKDNDIVHYNTKDFSSDSKIRNRIFSFEKNNQISGNLENPRHKQRKIQKLSFMSSPEALKNTFQTFQMIPGLRKPDEEISSRLMTPTIITNIVKNNNFYCFGSTDNNNNNNSKVLINNILPRSSRLSMDILKTKKAIILVDDSDMIRMSLKKLFETNAKIQSEYELLEGKDGIDILKYVMEDQANYNKIKLIVTDENMEYLCGSSAIAILRDFEKLKKIKKIYCVSLTAFADDDTKEYILSKGADIVLNKPLNKSMLEEFVTLLEEDEICR